MPKSCSSSEKLIPAQNLPKVRIWRSDYFQWSTLIWELKVPLSFMEDDYTQSQSDTVSDVASAGEDGSIGDDSEEVL